jgi:hypothetical protein
MRMSRWKQSRKKKKKGWRETTRMRNLETRRYSFGKPNWCMERKMSVKILVHGCSCAAKHSKNTFDGKNEGGMRLAGEWNDRKSKN